MAINTTKAEAEGCEDAETWLSETDSDCWDDAIKPGCLGADEALINAVGRDKAIEIMGGLTGVTDSEYTDLCHAYSRAWAERVHEEIAKRDAAQ